MVYGYLAMVARLLVAIVGATARGLRTAPETSTRTASSTTTMGAPIEVSFSLITIARSFWEAP